MMYRLKNNPDEVYRHITAAEGAYGRNLGLVFHILESLSDGSRWAVDKPNLADNFDPVQSISTPERPLSVELL